MKNYIHGTFKPGRFPDSFEISIKAEEIARITRNGWVNVSVKAKRDGTGYYLEHWEPQPKGSQTSNLKPLGKVYNPPIIQNNTDDDIPF